MGHRYSTSHPIHTNKKKEDSQLVLPQLVFFFFFFKYCTNQYVLTAFPFGVQPSALKMIEQINRATNKNVLKLIVCISLSAVQKNKITNGIYKLLFENSNTNCAEEVSLSLLTMWFHVMIIFCMIALIT